MSSTFRINALLRALNLTLEQFEDSIQVSPLKPTDKIVILGKDDIVVKKCEVVNDNLSIEELITIKNNAHRLLEEKMKSLQYMIDNPELYPLV